MRFRKLIKKTEEDGVSLREMSRAMKLPVSSLHQYRDWPTEPRLDALRKMSDYFGEPVSLLISEDDDVTAQLVALVRRLPLKEKKALLKSLSGK